MFLRDVEGWAYVIDSQYVEFEIQNKYQAEGMSFTGFHSWEECKWGYIRS